MQKVLLNMGKVLKIGTHSGIFHTDEALACYMLKKLPEYANAEIIRSRDSKELDSCDIVVDVGGVYDPAHHRYDHHQSTFSITMKSLRSEINSDIKLSSAGLIYHHFGERILEVLIGKPLDKIQCEKLFSYVYFNFVQEIDAVDNGIPMYETGEKRYGFNTDLSSRLSRLNLRWHSDEPTTIELFEKAMALAGKEFNECVASFCQDVWPARSIVQSAIDKRFSVHSSGEIIELQSCPWKSHAFEIEKEQNIEGTIKFGIFYDKTGGTWRACAMPVSLGNFILRVPLHKGWFGLRDDELQRVSGIADAIFVHGNGFIGGARSRDGALALAVKTLEYADGKRNDT